MFALIGKLDDMFVNSIKSRRWGTYLMLWLGATGGLAVATFGAFFVSMLVYGAVEPFFVAAREGHPVGLSWATMQQALRLSEIEGVINGALAFFGAPLLMSVQYVLGDYDHERAALPEVGVE